ncbi:MAG TPA: hypothetical protein ENH05_04825 [Rhizobiales bacterium]|nr:hypothetical protein [Hyphomicrobiales bacterium]
MASQSEIALVGSAKLEATPANKTEKKRARSAQSRKDEKRSAARKKSKQESKTQLPGASIVPVMKLRAVDIVDDDNATAPQQGKTGERNTDTAGDEGSRIIQMPPLVSAEMGGGQVDISQGSALGIAMPTGDDGEPLVTDPELLELLEQLSTTIDTANTVLDAASGAPAEEGADFNPKPEPSPQPESEPDDPPPLAAAAFTVPSPPEPPSRRRRGPGFGIVVNAAVTGVILATGAAWLAYTNPWLLESKPGAPSELEQTVSAPPVGNPSEATPGDQVLKSVAATPSTAPAPTTSPPDGGPAPMKATAPPAPAAAPGRRIRVAAGQSVPLTIALPATPDQTEISVMIQDVPNMAKLSAGKNLGAGNWLLEETELNKLTLNTTDGLAPGNYQLDIIFVRSDGKVPETRKVSLTVQPAASKAAASAAPVKLTPETASPDAGSVQTTIVKTGVAVEIPTASPKRGAAPAPEKQASVAETPGKPALSVEEVGSILTRGGALLNEGDIAGARLLFEYAAERGSKTAMIRLGESYDPKYLEKLGARGVLPDSAQAAHWYNRASGAQ